jgi:beta-glucosidase
MVAALRKTNHSKFLKGAESSKQVARRIADLLSQMTLEEKIGQMTQVEKNSLGPLDVARYFIGSVMSGGGGYPPQNTPAGWVQMTGEFQEQALGTRLGIPILYGVDAVHGHSNLRGATIFPHSIGLGASREPDLVYRIARATAEELSATGVHWNFFPLVAVPQDIRWGRVYECFSENTGLVAAMAGAYIRGLQGDGMSAHPTVLPTAKHFVGDGGTAWGSSTIEFYFGGIWNAPGELPASRFRIDGGDTRIDETTLRRVHLVPYIEAIAAGASIVMASFSSWNGVKMHGNRYLLTEVLKLELGFKGFVVTDWGGLDQLSPDYYQAVVAGINAGIDMCMVPQDFLRFISAVKKGVESGDISGRRIDDAVRRILNVKLRSGLFERPFPDPGLLPTIGSDEHRRLAREAVAKSAVLLKNEDRTLPISKSLPRILVAGDGAHDIGLQCGGWTIEWQGGRGELTPGTTILEAIRGVVSPQTVVEYEPGGDFSSRSGERGRRELADVGIAVVGEGPYAEGFGDREDLSLSEVDRSLIERLRQSCRRLVVVLLSGRPLILTDQLPLVDALVAAWLPGTEGLGLADVLFGDVKFNGKLPFTWPRSMGQVPAGSSTGEPLFPFGFGLE